MRTRIQRRLLALAVKPVNFDAAALDLANPPPDWNVDDRRQRLPPEPPGEPIPEGSWEIARRLVQGYEFADPSMVRAHYAPDRPLEGRDMLLELRTLAVVRIYVGVRVVEVYDEHRERDGRHARVYGWGYRTLEGHVEEGQMDWQVWKWLDTGEVEFRVYAVSRTAPIANPVVRLGFWLIRDHERGVFLASTNRRMRTFTEMALRSEDPGQEIRETGPGLTARTPADDDETHDQLARNLEDF